MKEKMKGMTTFQKGFLIYTGILVLCMLGLWFAAWHYASAYEQAQPVGAIDTYVEQTLKQELAVQIDDYSRREANAYQSEEEIRTVLTDKLMHQEWTYRKSTAYKSYAPVYTLYCGDRSIGQANLTAGESTFLDFGQVPWVVQPMEADLAQLEKTVTIVAPVDCAVTVNGAGVPDATETASCYPAFAAYEELIKQPVELAVYHLQLCIDQITVECPDGWTVVSAEKADTWYVLPIADETTQETLDTFANEFVDAYLMFTSNSGSYYNVQRYVAPGSDLQIRLYKSLDGMSWVHYTTGKLLDIEVSNGQYYGNVYTYDAAYDLKLKSGDWSGNMHVTAVQAAYGWRVVDVELF